MKYFRYKRLNKTLGYIYFPHPHAFPRKQAGNKQKINSNPSLTPSSGFYKKLFSLFDL